MCVWWAVESVWCVVEWWVVERVCVVCGRECVVCGRECVVCGRVVGGGRERVCGGW